MFPDELSFYIQNYSFIRSDQQLESMTVSNTGDKYSISTQTLFIRYIVY